MQCRTSSYFKLTALTGEAVTLFGTSGPSNGPYSVQLDGGQGVQYNATNAYPTNYGVVIYHADNLGPGQHQIIFTNLPATSGQYLSIDYAQLWTIAKYLILSSVLLCMLRLRVFQLLCVFFFFYITKCHSLCSFKVYSNQWLSFPLAHHIQKATMTSRHQSM